MIEFIKHEDLDTKLLKDGKTVVNIYADWCGPCKMLAPFLEELSNDHKVLKINADENQEYLKEMGVQGIPATFIYQGDKMIKRFDGFVPKEQLEAAL